MSNVVEMESFRKDEKSMNDVYEMKVIKVITTEETEIIEVNKDIDLNDEKTMNEMKLNQPMKMTIMVIVGVEMKPIME